MMGERCGGMYWVGMDGPCTTLFIVIVHVLIAKGNGVIGESARRGSPKSENGSGIAVMIARLYPEKA